MNFRTRVLLTVFVACVVCIVGAGLVASFEAEKTGYESLRDKSSAILSRLEAARHYVATQGMLDNIISDTVKKYPDGNLPKEQKLNVLKTVPIFASMKIGEKGAAEENYKFRIAAFDARNPDNAPTELEAKYLKAFEADPTLTEATYINEASNTYSVMRPIRLSESDGCMNCHGDPAKSVWGNGKDVLGYQMENWKDGKMHGMFTVVSDLAPLQAHIQETVWYIAKWGFGILFFCVLGAFLFVGKPLKQFLDTIINSVRGLSEASESVLLSGKQLTSSSTALAQGATQQAASLEETAASLEEISSMVKHNTDNAQQAESLSSSVRSVSESGSASMERMSEAMNSIKIAADETAEIIRTIDDIAFQTNLLALNAAVEAARAGDAGKGFAVVAEEVRNLSQRSAEAAKDTAEKIKRSTELADNGVRVSEEVSHSLTEIEGSVGKAADLVKEIASASKEQSDGLGQVNIAVSELDQVTQTNAASAEESAASSQDLLSQANTMQAIVADLARLAGIDATKQGFKSSKVASKPRAPKINGSDYHSNGKGTILSGEPVIELSSNQIIPLEDDNFEGM